MKKTVIKSKILLGLICSMVIVFLDSIGSIAQCISPPPPIVLKTGEEYDLDADVTGLQNYQWFRDTGSGPVAIAGANTDHYLATVAGVYTYTAQNQYGCPVTGCCPITFVVPTCTLTINSVVPSECDKWSNTYDVAVRVTYNINAICPIVINGQSFMPSALSGSETFKIGRFYSDGATGKIVTASIETSCSQSSTYNAPAPCRDVGGVIDPIGFIYCQQTGELVTGGSISVTGPVGSVVTIVFNGSTGRYQWFTNGVAGRYTMTYTPPPAYSLSTTCLPQSTALDPTGQPDPYRIGSAATGTTLNNTACAANPYYLTFDLDVGDPIVDQNNIPLTCPCPSAFAAALAVSCTGNTANADGKLHLNTLTNVTHYGYSTGNTYTGPAYAGASAISGATDILTGIGNPALPQPYTIRVFNRNECFKDYTATLQPKTCVCPPTNCLDITSTRIR